MDTDKDLKLLLLTELPYPLQGQFSRLWRSAAKTGKKALFTLTRHPRFLPVGGPAAVAESLKRGLKELQTPYLFNDRAVQNEVVCVLSDPAALRYAIEQKKKGGVRAVVAGPNVVHNPASEDSLIQDPAIDRILVPSAWTKDWWVSQAPPLADRLCVWGAGVSTKIPGSSHTGGAILFIKDEVPGLVRHITEQLKQVAIPVTVLRYGTFWRSEYLKALTTAKCMIYLSHTESQGIALAEAWMADVPTFVWNPGFFEIGGFSWKDSMMSAPYLKPECGTFFKDEGEFDRGISRYLQPDGSFSPRALAQVRFSDRASAEQYLKIVESIL